MPDIFISYSNRDQKFADFVHRHLALEGLDVFMASASLRPGSQWSPEIKANLITCSWVLFLASKAACQSAYVQQELGMALGANKRIVPIVWDIDPSQLPGWMKQFHALNLRNTTPMQIQSSIAAIARRIKSDKLQGQIIGAMLLAGLVYLATRE